jgi:hypothetical protein
VDDGRDFLFKDFNRSAERIDGVCKEDLIDNRLLRVFPNEDKFGIFSALQSVYQTGKPEQTTASYYKDDQREGSRENFISEVPSGEIVAIITEQKDPEAALRESKTR